MVQVRTSHDTKANPVVETNRNSKLWDLWQVVENGAKVELGASSIVGDEHHKVVDLIGERFVGCYRESRLGGFWSRCLGSA